MYMMTSVARRVFICNELHDYLDSSLPSNIKNKIMYKSDCYVFGEIIQYLLCERQENLIPKTLDIVVSKEIYNDIKQMYGLKTHKNLNIKLENGILLKIYKPLYHDFCCPALSEGNPYVLTKEFDKKHRCQISLNFDVSPKYKETWVNNCDDIISLRVSQDEKQPMYGNKASYLETYLRNRINNK